MTTTLNQYHQDRARSFEAQQTLCTARERMDVANKGLTGRHVHLIAARYYYRIALGLDGWERV